MPDSAELRDALIDRYLNRQLNEAERDTFELMLLEDEQLFARVQLLDAFKQGLMHERAALRERRELLALPFRAWLQQPFSIAAAVLVCGLGLQLAWTSLAPHAAGSSAIDTVFVLETTRGGGTPQLSGAPPYLFQVDAGSDAAGKRVAISLHDGATNLLRVESVPVDASGWARFVHSAPLAGSYTVEVSGIGAPRRYELRLND